MNCVNRGDASPSPVRPCVMRMAAVEKRGKNVEKNGGLSTDTGIIRQESLMLSQLRMP